MPQGISIVNGNGQKVVGFNLPDEAAQVTLICQQPVELWEYVCRIQFRSEDFSVRHGSDSYNLYASLRFIGPTYRFRIPAPIGGKRQIIFSKSSGIIRTFEYTWYSDPP